MSSPLTPVTAVLGTASFQTCGSAVPSSTIGWLKEMILCNTTAGAVQAYVCLVPNGGTAGVSNAIIYGYLVPASGIVPLGSLNTMMVAGYTIQVKGAGICFTPSWVEVPA